MFKTIARLFSKPAPSPTPKAPGLVPFDIPTFERVEHITQLAFDTGYWAWRNRADYEGPVYADPPEHLAAEAQSPYEASLMLKAYIDGLATAIAQEKSPCQ